MASAVFPAHHPDRKGELALEELVVLILITILMALLIYFVKTKGVLLSLE